MKNRNASLEKPSSEEKEQIPVFVSERICFMNVSEQFVNDYLVMVNDFENVNRFLGGSHKSYTAGQEIAWVREKLAMKAFVFSMIEKETGDFIGNIELMNPDSREGELGIALTAGKQNQGYGTEAVRAFTAYAMDHLGLSRIVLRTRPYNPRAIRVYEKCGFRTPKPNHSVTGTEEGKLVIDGKWAVTPQILNEAFAQNMIAAYTAAVEGIGIEPERAAELLDGIELDNGRVVEFDISGHHGRFMLCKHENSMAYNGAISTALRDPAEEVTVVFIVDRLSRKYVANDMSWLWDIDFDRLSDPKVKKVIVSGEFAHDAAARMLVGGVGEDRLIIEPDLDKMMDAVSEESEGTIYVMTCFTDQYKFLNRLKRYDREETR